MTATVALSRTDWLSRLRSIMVLRPGQRVMHIPGIGISMSRRAVASGAVDWWLAGGAPTPVAVYQPIRSASLAASYVNLANPGTYDAAPGTAPTFDAATGWTFNGTDQWLTTAANFSITGSAARTQVAYIRLLAAPAAYANSGTPSFGATSTGQNSELLIDSSRRLYGWGTGADVQGTTALTLNVWYAVAMSYDGTTMRVRTGAATNSAARALNTIASPLRIGKDFSNRFGNVDVAAGAIYDKELSDAEWTAVSAAMAAL